MRRSKVLVALAVAATLLGACGDDDESPSASTSEGESVITVHTAPDYEEIVGLLVDAYTAEHAGEQVEIVVQDQTDLSASIRGGDVALAVLPQPWVEGAGAEATGTLGRTLAIIVVAEGNPAGVTGADAFASDTDLATAVCGADTPIGNFSLAVLAKSGVTPDPGTVAGGCEDDAVERVVSGELDAVLLFRGGVVLPDGVEVVEIPEGDNIVVDVSLIRSEEVPAAEDFVALIASPTGQELLTVHGYLP